MKITSLKDNGPELKESLGNYAPLKARIYAFLLDYLLIIVYGIFVVGTISFVFRPVIAPLFSGSPITAQLTGFLLITLPVSLYFILCERSGWRGTWGKRRLGIRVVTDAGGDIGPVRATLRTAIKFLPWEIAHFGIWRVILPSAFSETTMIVLLSGVNLTILLYLIIPLTNRKRKNIYDILAGTVVMRML